MVGYMLENIMKFDEENARIIFVVQQINQQLFTISNVCQLFHYLIEYSFIDSLPCLYSWKIIFN